IQYRLEMLQLHGFGFREMLVPFRHIQTVKPSLLGGVVLSKNRMLVVMEVYGENTLPGKRMMVWRSNSRSSFFLMFTLALSVPNRNPSGRITDARPPRFSRYMMTDINRSAVSELARSSGK